MKRPTGAGPATNPNRDPAGTARRPSADRSRRRCPCCAPPLPRLQAPGAADPHVHFAHRADGAALNHFHHAPVVLARVNLHAHLRGDFGSTPLRGRARLPDVVRERLFAIDVLASLAARAAWQRRACARRCSRRRRRIARASRTPCGSRRISSPADACGPLVDGGRVDVAQGGDVLGGDALDVGAAAAAGADDRDIQFVVEILPAQNRRRPLRATSAVAGPRTAAAAVGEPPTNFRRVIRRLVFFIVCSPSRDKPGKR